MKTPSPALVFVNSLAMPAPRRRKELWMKYCLGHLSNVVLTTALGIQMSSHGARERINMS